MEFRWAADGKTEELRQWLREHPERVNVPARGSNMTLLYTCISNSDRTDVASLQAGCSSYLRTVQMLCEEYKADVLAANGGSDNTALHLAASIGATSVVRYLVEVLHTPVDSTNVFGERPLRLAERNGHKECVAILAAATAAATVSSAQSPPLTGRHCASSQPESLGGQHGTDTGLKGERDRLLRRLVVSDSDDDDNSDAGERMKGDVGAKAPHFHSGSNPPQSPDGIGSSSRPTQITQAGSSGTARYTSTPARSSTLIEHDSVASLTLPSPVQPRREYDITGSRILANPDLQGFRFVYGDGFRFIQCSDHYEIRGILPYTYRGKVYYTPVIISVYAPDSSADFKKHAPVSFAAGGPDAGSAPGDGLVSGPSPGKEGAYASRAAGVATPSPKPVGVYCRYRVCVNLQVLNEFAISRKAEYLDPISGAVIPAPGDDQYRTLTAYIRNVVVRNFEAVPPLIAPTSSYAFPLAPNLSWLGTGRGGDFYRHHHSHTSPDFMQNALPKRSAAHIRCATILRELSRFGDGLARYNPEQHRITAYVPIFSERKVAVLAVPQERPYTTTAGQGSTAETAQAKSVEGTASSLQGKDGVTQQVGVEAVVELQIRVLIQFRPKYGHSAAGGADVLHDGEASVYAYPPRIYLVDAASCPQGGVRGDDLTSTNAAALASPSSSSASPSLTAQCFAGIIKHPDTGEVRPELLYLTQETWSSSGSVYEILVALQRALKGVLESFAMSYTGRRSTSSPMRDRGISLGSVHRTAGTHSNPPAVYSALDNLFHPSSLPTRSSATGPVSGANGSVPRSSAGYCFYCMQPMESLRAQLLMPCGHEGLCALCVQRLQSHCREEEFACPVCRGAVRYVMEVISLKGKTKGAEE